MQPSLIMNARRSEVGGRFASAQNSLLGFMQATFHLPFKTLLSICSKIRQSG